MNFERWIKRKRMIILSCMLLVVLLTYLSFSSYSMYVVNSQNYKAEAIDAMNHRVDSLFLEINDFPRDEGDDVLYLGKLENLKRLVNSASNGITSAGPDGSEWDKARYDLGRDFLAFLEVNDIYYQLRYIDGSGQEVIRVDYDGENYSIVDDVDLQNKADRYYFEDSLKLDKGEVYVSRLDLNVDNGVLENRGTEEKPEYVPIIRYSTPVFDDDGEAKGIVILNVYADYFLEDIRRLNNEGETMFLIDNEGYYLAHFDKSKEFSFMFDGKESFIGDYPEVAHRIVRGFDLRNIEGENYIFNIRHFYPTIGTFEVYQGSEKVFGENPEDEYYWVLVSVSDREIIEMQIRELRSEFFVFVLFSGIMISLILILLVIILVMNGKLKK